MVPKENADLFDEIYDINNIQLVPLKDQSENLNTEEVNERFDADLIGLEFARDNLKMSKSKNEEKHFLFCEKVSLKQ